MSSCNGHAAAQRDSEEEQCLGEEYGYTKERRGAMVCA